MQKPARIIFAGSPDFAVPALESLMMGPHDVVAVLTQPDRPAGRGRKVKPSPVKAAAVAAGLPVLQPDTLQGEAIQAALSAKQPDIMVVVAYGLLLPQEILQLPKRGCINLHASLLPRWRGASPIQTAILAGDTETGVGLMLMDAGLDTGPVYVSESLSIGAHETADQLHDRLASLGASLLDKYLDTILVDELQPTAQPEEGVTYARLINKNDGSIDWTQSALCIDRQIRAYTPWPVAHTLYKGERLRCLAGVAVNADGAFESGTLLGLEDDGLRVQTGEGVLALTRLQLAGRKPVSAREFANAHAVDDVVLGQ